MIVEPKSHPAVPSPGHVPAVWGPITGSSIIGKVVLTWWHDGHPDFHGP